MLAATGGDTSLVLLELGAVAVGLALVASLARRLGLTPIPLYLIAGLAVGQGGIVQLELTEDFIALTADIGVLLLLLALGLEYSAAELTSGLRTGRRAGALDAVGGFVPGFAAGLLLGWDGATAMLLGGATWVSSSGIVAKLLRDLDRLGNRETPAVLTILVIEDLAMAVFLPVAAVIAVGDDATTAVRVSLIAVATVVGFLVVALRWGGRLSRALGSPSDEATLLGVFGITLVVGGLAEQLGVSAAIGAFLVGLAVSGPIQHRAAQLIGPLRDLFAATFFLFFSLQIDPSRLPAVLPEAAVLAIVTGATKTAVGWYAAARAGTGRAARMRAGTVLIARGEFSVIVASLAAGEDAGDLRALVAAYLLLLAVGGPLLTKLADRPSTR